MYINFLWEIPYDLSGMLAYIFFCELILIGGLVFIHLANRLGPGTIKKVRHIGTGVLAAIGGADSLLNIVDRVRETLGGESNNSSNTTESNAPQNNTSSENNSSSSTGSDSTNSTNNSNNG